MHITAHATFYLTSKVQSIKGSSAELKLWKLVIFLGGRGAAEQSKNKTENTLYPFTPKLLYLNFYLRVGNQVVQC